MQNCFNTHLYIASFVAGSDSGLAFISAASEKDAIQVLRNTGRYNGTPDEYKILQIRDIGMSSTIRSELLMESYVNALVAFDAISAVVKPYIGPQGPQGKSAYEIAREYGYSGDESQWLADLKGDTGDTGPAAGFGNLEARITNPLEVGTPSVTLNTSGPDTAKNMEFLFSHIRGQVGPQGETGPMVPTINNLDNTLDGGGTAPSTYAISSAQGPVIKNMISGVNAELTKVAYIGATLESWSDTSGDGDSGNGSN